MIARKNLRSWVLGFALLITLSATTYLYLNDVEPDGGIEVIITASARHSGTQVPQAKSVNVTAPVSFVQNRFLQGTSQDIFHPKFKLVETAKEVSSPPPPPPVIIAPALPPPIPTAPPVPFTYIGKYMEDGKLVVYLGYAGKNLIVKTGDVIQQIYKIEDIKPPLLTLTYLPMDIKQSIQIGELQ